MKPCDADFRAASGSLQISSPAMTHDKEQGGVSAQVPHKVFSIAEE